MIPCGEDLGVGIACVPETMLKHDILGLRVVRWSRKWSEENQPYVDFEDYTPLSVTTTSVHDSSTIRQWWEDELPKEDAEEICSVRALVDEENQYSEFTPEIAKQLLINCGKAASKWYINPLQDYLYTNKKYWLENAEDERINVPGSVNEFNWTYRIPASIEELTKDKTLINTIKIIAKR